MFAWLRNYFRKLNVHEVPLVKKHPFGVKTPTQAYDDDAGYDLYAAGDYYVHQGQVVPIETGLHMAIPNHLTAKIECRSGLGRKGFDVKGGRIDSGYRGQIIVLLQAPGDLKEPYKISHGDKIAQLVFQHRLQIRFVETNDLPPSERDTKGFGSSGK